ASDVRLSVYTVDGVKVIDLDAGFRSAGSHTLNWNAMNCPSGVYVIRFQAGSIVQMRKCMLMK
ncbi:MAG TPA: T9SS type A sorting domain-containing protein, partial [bacterium]